MVAEILFGLQLIRHSCKAIEALEDPAEIGGLIEQVFKGQEQVQSKSHPIASKINKYVKGSTSDKFLQLAVTEHIEESEARRAIDRLSLFLNRKYGDDTWTQIMLAREEKRKEHEEALENKRLVSKRRWKKIGNILGTIFAICTSVGVIVGMIILGKK